MQGRFTLEARNVGIAVPHRRLLEGVSLTISPSELVCIMGPSGAGKTTLLTALNGYVRPTTGAVLLNGIDLHANYDRFASSIGYVPQDDIVHRELTVRQALRYSARLRLGSQRSLREIDSRVSSVLKELNLCDVQGMLIGSPETKNAVSGGERKRVNLAMELLTDPSLMFLDEPTSGLSSGDALAVMRMLRRLADTGKTVLLTIHQPSLEAFRLADKLVFVAREPGRAAHVVYHGAAYPDAVTFFNPDGVPNVSPHADPPPEAIEDGYRRGCEKHGHCGWVNRFQASHYAHDVRTPSTADYKSASRQSRELSKAAPRPSAAAQWLTLVSRTLAVKVRDVRSTMILLAQAPIVGLLIEAVFSTQVTGTAASANPMATSRWIAVAIFILVLSALWFGCSNAIRDIVGERAIYRREQMLGLKTGPYLASKFTVLGGLCFLQCAVLLGLVIAGCELKGSWPAMFLLLFLVALVGVGIGLFVSAFARTSEAAIAMLPIVLLPMVILGGAMMPVHKMFGVAQVVAQAMPSRWGFEGMLLLESDAREPFVRITKATQSEAALVTATGDLAEAYFPIDGHRFGVQPAIFALIATLAALALGSCVALQNKSRRLRGRRAHFGAAAAQRRPRTHPTSPPGDTTLAPASTSSRGRGFLRNTAASSAILIAVCAYALLPIAEIRSRARRNAPGPNRAVHQGRLPPASQGADSSAPVSDRQASESVIAPLTQRTDTSARRPDLNPSDAVADQTGLLSRGDSSSARDWLPTAPHGDMKQASVGESYIPGSAVPPSQHVNPTSTENLVKEAEREYRSGDFSGAIASFTRLINVDPGNAYYFGCRARSHLALDQIEEALDDANQAIRLDATDALSWHVRASVLEEVGEFDLAGKAADRALELATDNRYDAESIDVLAQRISLLREKSRRSKELFERGKRFFSNSEYRLAITQFTDVLAIKPNSFASYHYRAVAYDRIREYSYALADLDDAIALNLNDASLFEARAYVREHINDHTAALRDIAEAIRLDPSQTKYSNYRDKLLIQHGLQSK